MKKKMICLLMLAFMLLLSMACQQTVISKEPSMTQTQPITTEQDQPYNATYKAIAQAFDWGPACTKVIIKLSGDVEPADLCGFRVTETNTNGAVGERAVTAVYLCDENGREVEDSSRYITVEMNVNPSHGGMFYYDRSRYLNVWDDQYSLTIEPVDPKADLLKNLSVDPLYSERMLPQAEVFTTAEFPYQETTIQYALYTPDLSGAKKPLVVWLHGQGEGGNDVTVTLLGNKVTALAEDPIQSMLGGAYVLVPQCPTYWPENTPDNRYYGMRGDGASCWEKPLLGLIDEVVAANSAIDPARIYIGGCSMGGYMTMLMAKNHSDKFAVAFPVCEVYNDAFIDEKDIGALAQLPLWLTYCKADQTVPPRQNSEATIARLKKAGAVNLHTSIFEDVHDTSGVCQNEDGTPYTYDAHWVWIYVFNNECYDGEQSLWRWLALQHK